MYISIHGKYDALKGIKDGNEEYVDNYFDDNYDYYVITGITGDLSVSVGFEYPDEGCIGGYYVEFVTNGFIADCDGINSDDTVYTGNILLCSFKEGKRIWHKDAEKKELTFEVKEANPDFEITGEYENITDNEDGTYTISGITSDLTVSLQSEFPTETGDVAAGHAIQFFMPDNMRVYEYDSENFDTFFIRYS